MEDCNKDKPGTLVEASFCFEAENGYTYLAIATGKIVKRYSDQIGAGFYQYQVLFDRPRWPNSQDLLVDMVEHDLRFV